MQFTTFRRFDNKVQINCLLGPSFNRYGQALKKTKMKTLISIIFLTLFVSVAKCQLIDTKYLTGVYTESKDNSVPYIKETYKTESGYKILLFNNPKCISNNIKVRELISECNYKSLNPLVEDGYFKDDKLSGQYKNGEMIGIWYKQSNFLKEKHVDTLDYNFEVINNKYIDQNFKNLLNQKFGYKDTLSSAIYMKLVKDICEYFVYPSKYMNSGFNGGSTNIELVTNSNGDVIQVFLITPISPDVDKETIRTLLKCFPKVKNWNGTIPIKFTVY